MTFTMTRNFSQKILLRGDSSGRVTFWVCPDLSDIDILKLDGKKCPGRCFSLNKNGNY